MKIKLEDGEQVAVLKALTEAKIPVSYAERDVFNRESQIFFSRRLTPEEQANTESLVAVALKNYHFREIQNFDLDKLHDLTPKQLNSYIDANVTDLASAKAFLKKLSALILYIINRRLDD